MNENTIEHLQNNLLNKLFQLNSLRLILTHQMFNTNNNGDVIHYNIIEQASNLIRLIFLADVPIMS